MIEGTVFWGEESVVAWVVLVEPPPSLSSFHRRWPSSTADECLASCLSKRAVHTCN